MAQVTKEFIEDLKKRASEVNNKIIQASTKKEIAQKRVKELLAELGYDSDSMSNEEILALIEKLEKEEAEKVDKFKQEIEAAEAQINNPQV